MRRSTFFYWLGVLAYAHAGFFAWLTALFGKKQSWDWVVFCALFAVAACILTSFCMRESKTWKSIETDCQRKR